MKGRNRARRRGPECGELALQNGAAAVIFVPQIDIDVVYADRPCGDNRAFEKSVWIALEVVAVLERAGLALVDVDRHEPGSGLARDNLPFAAGREAGAAEPPQPRILHDRDDVCRCPL